MRIDNRRGFTIIELLVVVGIIAILTALLLPVVGRAKARARQTICLNNLRQINFGIRMYADDSGDKTPRPEGTKLNRLLSFTGYKNFIRSYVGPVAASSPKAKLFACPADSFFYTRANGLIVAEAQPMHEQSFADFSSYGFNGGNLATNLNRLGVDLSQCGIAGRTISSISDPVTTVLVAEASTFEPWSWHQPKRPLSQENAQFNDARNIVSFVDGHVSYIKIFWTDTSVTSRVRLAAAWINPPPGYDYRWSGD